MPSLYVDVNEVNDVNVSAREMKMELISLYEKPGLGTAKEIVKLSELCICGLMRVFLRVVSRREFIGCMNSANGTPWSPPLPIVWPPVQKLFQLFSSFSLFSLRALSALQAFQVTCCFSSSSLRVLSDLSPFQLIQPLWSSELVTV